MPPSPATTQAVWLRRQNVRNGSFIGAGSSWLHYVAEWWCQRYPLSIKASFFHTPLKPSVFSAQNVYIRILNGVAFLLNALLELVASTSPVYTEIS